MAEPLTPEKQVGGQEQKGSPEILDLPKYGALYGRFLLASQAKTAGEIASIINPANTTVEFNLTADTLDKRNYNPVFENFSFAERKEEWKDFIPSTTHPTAYSQWRTEFTRFMVNIQDPKRALALKAILSNNKEAKEFTVIDADTLFNDFCKDKSDITKFIERVTTNPTNLQELLPHLAWIASGLFGKNTSSDVVTRLIELESVIHNNPGQVVEIFNSNKERINTPIDEEKRVLLGLLSSYLRKEKEIIPTQEIKPLIAVVSRSAPVIPGPSKEEDQLPVAPLLPPPPPILQAEEAVDGKPPSVSLIQRRLKVGYSAANEIQRKIIAGNTTLEAEAAKLAQGSSAEQPPSAPLSPAPEALKTSAPAEAVGPTADQANASSESIINMEDISPTDIPKKLNELLEKYIDWSYVPFRFSPDQVKEYIISVAKGYRVQTGTIYASLFEDKITIENVQISKSGGKITFGLIITNNRNGITAETQNYKANLLARTFGGDAKNQIANIDSTVKEGLNKQIAKDNPLWKTSKISISEGNFLIRFEKNTKLPLDIE